jgi:hypothetical protein
MEQTDFILRQIQQIGILIKSLYDKLFKETSLSDSEKIELFKIEFEKIFEIKFEKIENYSKTEFNNFLNERRINKSHKAVLAETLLLISQNSHSNYNNKLLEKSFFLYENIINENPNEYSIKEQNMIMLIKEKLDLPKENNSSLSGRY